MDELREYIHRLRQDFSKSALKEEEAEETPSQQFKKWMQQAAETRIPELQAMHLSTASSSARPSSRIVYLREFGEDAYCFYTNYNSRKAKELLQNPQATLTFFWPQLERQIRIEGLVEKAPAAQSDAYYDLRPYDSKIGAWASRQSEKLASRQELEKRTEELKKQFAPDTIKRPEFWGGLVLKATCYEFWQGRKSRLHDRLCYEKENNQWTMYRLAP